MCGNTHMIKYIEKSQTMRNVEPYIDGVHFMQMTRKVIYLVSEETTKTNESF